MSFSLAFRPENLIGPIIGGVSGFIVVVVSISLALRFGFKWSEKRTSTEQEYVSVVIIML